MFCFIVIIRHIELTWLKTLQLISFVIVQKAIISNEQVNSAVTHLFSVHEKNAKTFQNRFQEKANKCPTISCLRTTWREHDWLLVGSANHLVILVFPCLVRLALNSTAAPLLKIGDFSFRYSDLYNNFWKYAQSIRFVNTDTIVLFFTWQIF